MVCTKLAYLAIIAGLCQMLDAQSLRRVRPGCAMPQVVPRVPAPAPYRPYDKISNRNRYECNLEEIISKLVNALIYTVLRKDGSGAGGGNGGAGGGSGGGAGGGSGSGAGGGSGGGAGGGSGGGAGGGNGSGGGAGNGGSGSTSLLNSLLALELALGGTDILDLDVLPGISGDN
ncbi:uncharacterized protein [Choristoneura fumiferana]|uniref:uncharacterized protein n=1 Tax=Choristoneura fumiferana TaxID=7141 RepID=UPI003D15E742